MAAGKEEQYLKLFAEETSFYTRLLLPERWCHTLPFVLQSWLRNCVGAIVIYFVASLLCLSFWKRYSSSPKGSMISRKDMISQICEALKAIPLGVFLHTGIEYMVVKGWTKCYPRLSDVGYLAYVIYVLCYLIVVEFGTYWAHRLIHEIKPVYKYIHRGHHLYGKEESLSPFAGWAVHPLEGIIMGSPHGIAILIVPTHFTTHLVLLFIQSVWGIIIHDRTDGLFWPIMNSQFHTIHHTSGHYNYGNFTVCMDKLFGTLRNPKSCIIDHGNKQD